MVTFSAQGLYNMDAVASSYSSLPGVRSASPNDPVFLGGISSRIRQTGSTLHYDLAYRSIECGLDCEVSLYEFTSEPDGTIEAGPVTRAPSST